MSLDVNREKAIELAVTSIEKQFGKGSIMRLGLDEALVKDVPVVSTGSPSLDLALFVGGIPRGRFIEIFGPEASGKTTLALHAVAEAQKQGGIVAFIDAFRTVDHIFVLTSGGPSRSSTVLLFELWQQRFEYQDIGASAAITVIFVIVLLAFTVTNFITSERKEV